MTWKGEPLAYSNLLTPAQTRQVEKRVKEKEQDAVYYATAPKPNPKNKTYEAQVKKHARDRQQFVEMREAKNLSFSEAQQKLVDHYLRPDENGKPGHLAGTKWFVRAKALAELYGKKDPSEAVTKWRNATK